MISVILINYITVAFLSDKAAEDLHKVQEKYENEVKSIDTMIEHMTYSRMIAREEKRKEKLKKQIAEVKEYDEILDHIANERIDIDLDDGVKVNYEKVQTEHNGKKYKILAPIKYGRFCNELVPNVWLIIGGSILVRIEKILFSNKQKIPWKEVKAYMKKYEGETAIVKEYGDKIRFNYVSASEYSASKYSQKLKGANAKAKANLVQILPEVVEEAKNRRWIENNADKHESDAKNGWYRYDIHFEIPVKTPDSEEIKWNQYMGTLVVRANDMGLFFYDIINIKKETSTPGES